MLLISIYNVCVHMCVYLGSGCLRAFFGWDFFLMLMLNT